MLDFANIPLNDEKTFHLLGMGLTKGIFQLEEHLGERYCQIVKPKSIEDIADITAIIRPGCKEAFHVDGETTMLDAYCKIRNGEMQEAYLHEDLRVVLGKTYSVLIYQEQITEICQHMAGMTLEEGDMVRYAMGKKRIELMVPWKTPFLDGCVKKGYTRELGEKMWDWIEKSAGYLFNKSHAIAYGLTAYQTAYAKINYPTAFYTAMLKYADKKLDTYDEMLYLINDAKLFDIRVSPPRIQDANADFLILDKKNITFGIRYLKGVGEHGMSAIERLKGVNNWNTFLLGTDRYKVDKTSTEALIKAGVLDSFGISRMQMVAEYEMFRELTRNEQMVVLSLISNILHPEILIEIDSADFEQKRTVTKYIKLHKTGIFDRCGRYGPIAGLPLPQNTYDFSEIDRPYALEYAVEDLIGSCVPTAPRIAKLQALLNLYRSQAPYTPNIMTYQVWEKHYFGIPLTHYDKMLVTDPRVTPCIEVINVMPDQNVVVIGEIEKVSLAKIKRGDSKGKTMAFIDIADNSYMLKGVIAFSECYDKYGSNITEGLPVRIKGRKMRDSNSILAFSVERL
jgi:DNA polymerase III alpha subunit